MIKAVDTLLPYRVTRPTTVDESRVIGAWCASELGVRARTEEVFRVNWADWELVDHGGRWFCAGTNNWYFRTLADAVMFMMRWKALGGLR